MKEKMKKLRKNNKGFSLVELIIVIAIMAVLVGILAPQFIKYVEKSRVSTDIKNGQEVLQAINAYASDAASDSTLDDIADGDTVTLATDADPDGSSTAMDTALSSAGLDKLRLKSSSWDAGGVTITANVDGTTGNLTFTVSDADYAIQ